MLPFVLGFGTTQIDTGTKVFAYRFDALGLASRQYKRYGTRAVPYRCPHCDKWHLTTNVKAPYDPEREYRVAVESKAYYE